MILRLWNHALELESGVLYRIEFSFGPGHSKVEVHSWR